MSAEEQGLRIRGSLFQDHELSYYQLLGVSEDASQKDIRKAFLRKSKVLHPDKDGGQQYNSTKQFDYLIRAYEVLSDPKRRKKYDNRCSLSHFEMKQQYKKHEEKMSLRHEKKQQNKKEEERKDIVKKLEDEAERRQKEMYDQIYIDSKKRKKKEKKNENLKWDDKCNEKFEKRRQKLLANKDEHESMAGSVLSINQSTEGAQKRSLSDIQNERQSMKPIPKTMPSFDANVFNRYFDYEKRNQMDDLGCINRGESNALAIYEGLDGGGLGGGGQHLITPSAQGVGAWSSFASAGDVGTFSTPTKPINNTMINMYYGMPDVTREHMAPITKSDRYMMDQRMAEYKQFDPKMYTPEGHGMECPPLLF